MFKKAVKHDARLRLAICGPSGSGKSFSSLALATEIAGGGKIAAVDTERGSLSKYADKFDFDVVEFASYDPLKLIEAIKSAEAAGYSAFIIDSLSHFWFGKDGELDKVDQVAKRSDHRNSFAAWKEVTPIHNKLVDALLGSKMHIFCTMRTKTEWVLDKVMKNGKEVTVPRKIGLAPIMRDGIEFEFDVCGDMDQDNNFLVSKTRCPQLLETNGGVYNKPGKEMAEILREWLSGAPRPEPKTREQLKAEMVANIQSYAETLSQDEYEYILGQHGMKSAADVPSSAVGNKVLVSLAEAAKEVKA